VACSARCARPEPACAEAEAYGLLVTDPVELDVRETESSQRRGPTEFVESVQPVGRAMESFTTREPLLDGRDESTASKNWGMSGIRGTPDPTHLTGRE
jgi:hypothetical protein